MSLERGAETVEVDGVIDDLQGERFAELAGMSTLPHTSLVWDWASNLLFDSFLFG